MIALVNYANEKFRKKQKWNSLSAKILGKIDKIYQYNETKIDSEFLKKNKENIKYKNKGAGNFFWKPYIVNDVLNKINYGDFLVYADSGSLFLKNIKPLVNFLELNNKDILCFKLPLTEKQWTKRDTFILMDADTKEFKETPQILATYFLIKKSKFSVDFINKWKTYCCDSRILSDDSNVMGKNNDNSFIAHRHDQSVLSLLCKKNTKDILVVGDASDYGYYPYKYYKNTNRLFTNNIDYPFKGFLVSTRNEKIIIYLTKYFIRRVLLLFKVRL